MPRTTDFATFCQATRAWLATAPSLDPALAAAADLLECSPAERSLGALWRDAADSHTLLGAHTLEALFELSDPDRVNSYSA
jgi:hypothetical protein